MSLPDPPTKTALDGSCSVIYENTLYSYSPSGLFSLSLVAEAEWKTLPKGESVSGAECVLTKDSLFVVGGTGGSDGYTGLQKYSFSAKKWTTITPSLLFTQNRQDHGVAYLEELDQIVVYAGSTDGSTLANSDCWAIGASEPYNVKAFPASSHWAVKPILLKWSSNQLALVGGNTANVAVPLFDYTNGWLESGITLAQGLPKDTSSMQAILVDGTDSSKSLYTFDLSVSPNEVTRYVLQNADGTRVSGSSAITKRDLTLDDWPEYNSTNAPRSPRTNFAIAQSDGMVVFSGGNSDVPLAMFDATENSWLDSSEVFAVQAQSLESVSTSTESSKTKTSSTKTKSHSSTETSTLITSTFSSTSTSTGSLTISDASAAATSTDAAAAAGGSSDSSSGLSSNAVLGITLGSILGFLALLLVLLLLLRRRKKVKQQNDDSVAHTRGLSSDEKAPMVFHDAPPPASSPGHLRGHNPQFSQESYSSMAILMGRAGKPKTGLTRKPSADSNRSSSSTLHKQLKSKISKPILHDMPHPVLENQEPRGVAFDPSVAEPRPRPRQPGPMETEDGMRRSSGWNRYWSGGSALQILGFGGPPKRVTVADDDGSSHYSESTQYHPNPRATQDSATVPPLNFDFKPEFNRVNSGSPVVEKYNGLPFKEGMTGKIERPSSKASSGYSSGIPESVNEQWQSSNQPGKAWGADRAPSSVYNPSVYYGAPLSPSTGPPPRNMPSGVSTQPQLAMASTSSDMSWLNLGDRRV
ncbi:hypothetical protein B0T10DRAFT_555908 [Thelonectria olida]|uniref:Pre-mRNA splicing factor CLF1 n=1 Tax=Thelonectria olida TaxID=1576542 RepID=A0A9P8WGV0_9HYPO|nr:hypothetical protein B0T10DRAFT_555908 [Thelonectria olida]